VNVVDGVGRLGTGVHHLKAILPTISYNNSWASANDTYSVLDDPVGSLVAMASALDYSAEFAEVQKDEYA
jgi:hypothetical protein